MTNDRRRMRLSPPVGFYPPPRRTDDHWEIPLCGELHDKQSDLISRLVELPRRSEGLIYIDSTGGSVYTGLALASIIRLRGLRATAVVAGECSSAALFPFAACVRRFVTPHTASLFHPIRWQSEDECRFEEAVEWARHFKHMEKDLDGLLAKMLGVTDELLAEWTRPGKYVTGPELVEAGLAEELNLFGDDIWTQIELPKPRPNSDNK